MKEKEKITMAVTLSQVSSRNGPGWEGERKKQGQKFD